MKFFLIFLNDRYRVAHIDGRMIFQVTVGNATGIEIVDVTDYLSGGKVVDKELFSMVYGEKRCNLLVEGLLQMKKRPVIFKGHMGVCTYWLELEDEE